MMNKTKRTILVFLAFLMLFQTFQPGLDALAHERRLPDRLMPIEAVETDAEGSIQPEPLERSDAWPDLSAPSDDSEPVDPEEEEESTELTGEDVVGEIVYLREANVKHFRMSDGSIIAVMYDTDVHFQDEDDEWVDIDNSLRLDTGGETPVSDEIEELFEELEAFLEYAEDVDAEELQEILVDVGIGVEDIVFATEDSLVDISFNLESGCEDTPDFLLEHDGYSVGLSLIGADEQIAEVVPTEPNPEDNSIAAAVQPANLTNRIIYRDVLPGVDLEYVIHGHDVKENIIVNHLLDSHTFFFELDLGALRPVHNEDGSILLVSRETEEEVFLIPAPFMWDANDEFSTAVRYELVPAGQFDGDSELETAYFPEIADWDDENADEDGRYLFVVIVDEDWMRAEERAFPVTIDPPIINVWNRTQSNEGNISTGFARSGQPGTGSGGSANLFFGFSAGGAGWGHMYLRMNRLPELPRNSIMVQAEVHLAHLTYSSVGKPNMRIPVYALADGASNTHGAWLNNINWGNRPRHDETMLDYATVSNDTRFSFVSWNITRAVQDWYDDDEKNFGLAFVPLDYAGGAPPANRRANATFAVDTHVHASARPIFVVHYRNTVGLVGHHTYTSQSLGRAGTGHVGDFMGQLTVVNPIVANASSVMPFTLSMVYNSQWANRNFTQYTSYRQDGATINTRVFDRMRFGHGWKPSVLQTVTERALPDSRDGVARMTTFLVHLNATGTEHYFREGDDGYFRDEDGLGLRMRREGNTITMRDDQNNRQIFYNGILSEIIDRNGNRIWFVYNDTTNWRPRNDGTNRLYQIRQQNNGGSEITLARFGYDGATNQLTTITDRAGNETRFHYEGDHLSVVAYSDAMRAQYSYDNQGRLIEARDSESGHGVRYRWGGLCHQIIGIRPFAGSESRRVYAPEFWRNGRMPGATLYRDTGQDGVAFNYDDIIEQVVFDHFGRTVNYYITDYTEQNVLAASTSRFTRQTGTDRRTNRVEQTATIGVPAVNLLRNSGLEDATPQGHANHWNQRNGTGVVENISHARTGSRSLQAQNVGDTGATQTVTLTPGQTYVFSAYVNTSRVTSFAANGDVILFFTPARGDAAVAHSPRFNMQTNPTANGGWQRLSVSHTSINGGTYNVGITFRGITGTVNADDFQLEAVHVPSSNGPSSANLVQNGGFADQTLNAGPDDIRSYHHWTRFNTPANPDQSTIERDADRESNVLTMQGHPDRRAFVFQDIPIHLPSSETFVLSGWARAESLPFSGSNWEPGFGLVARIVYADGESEHVYLRFNDHIREGANPYEDRPFDGWQFGSVPIVPRRADQTVASIRVMTHYNHNANRAQFSNISLIREAAQAFRYDENGNLVSVQQSGLRDVPESGFDGNNNLIRQATQGHGTFHYTYDNNQNLTRIISGPENRLGNHNLVMDIGYDGSGNATRSTLTGSNDTEREALGHQLVSSATFCCNGRLTPGTDRPMHCAWDRNLLVSTTDANGTERINEYRYGMTHHRMYGVPTRTTVNAGDEPEDATHTDTRIDRHTGRPVMTFQDGLVAAQYFYADGNLSAIRRHGFAEPDTNVAGRPRIYQTYNFRYNDFGQMTEISLGNYVLGSIVLFNPETGRHEGLTQEVGSSHTLKTYEYHPVDHTLTSRTYGNGHRVNYTYDFLRRVTGVEHCDGTRFAYSYTGDGQLHGVQEFAPRADEPRRSHEYTYDSLGRLVTFTERGRDNILLQHGTHSYDDAGRMTEFRYHIPGITPAGGRNNFFRFDGDTGNLDRMYLASGQHWRLDYTYDNLQRLHSRQLIGGIRWETLYNYRMQSGNTSTMQVRWMTQWVGNEDLRFRYEYDNIGQITEWFDPANRVTHGYEYDVQNQLVAEEITGERHHEFTYSYDTFGNIRERRHWRGLSHAVSPRVMQFSYDYELWPDLLTGVNGNPITYDLSGNPTRWHDGREFTWERGRQLTRTHGNGFDVTFEYDVNGIRTAKTVTDLNGLITNQHTFYTQGGRIVAERREFGDGRVHTLEFFYDEAGRPLQVFFCNGDGYQRVLNYVLNLQGDVIEVRNPTDGSVYARYLYNAWGELLESSGWFAEHNPIRYRGYYHCLSSGFYYLESRYYCPTIGRFINADALWVLGVNQGNLLEFNLFTYCFNNPVNLIDPEGYGPITIGVIIGAGKALAKAAAKAAAPYVARATATVGAVGSNVWNNVIVPAKQQVVTWGSNTLNSIKTGFTNFGNTLSGWWNNFTNQTPLYRAVSPAEAADIIATGRFNLVHGGTLMKQFGFSMEEAIRFGQWAGQTDVAYIIRVKVPNAMLHLFDMTRVDTTVFRSGTLTVHEGMLDIFNQIVSLTIRLFLR